MCSRGPVSHSTTGPSTRTRRALESYLQETSKTEAKLISKKGHRATAHRKSSLRPLDVLVCIILSAALLALGLVGFCHQSNLSPSSILHKYSLNHSSWSFLAQYYSSDSNTTFNTSTPGSVLWSLRLHASRLLTDVTQKTKANGEYGSSHLYQPNAYARHPAAAKAKTDTPIGVQHASSTDHSAAEDSEPPTSIVGSDTLSESDEPASHSHAIAADTDCTISDSSNEHQLAQQDTVTHAAVTNSVNNELVLKANTDQDVDLRATNSELAAVEASGQQEVLFLNSETPAYDAEHHTSTPAEEPAGTELVPLQATSVQAVVDTTVGAADMDAAAAAPDVTAGMDAAVVVPDIAAGADAAAVVVPDIAAGADAAAVVPDIAAGMDAAAVAPETAGGMDAAAVVPDMSAGMDTTIVVPEIAGMDAAVAALDSSVNLENSIAHSKRAGFMPTILSLFGWSHGSTKQRSKLTEMSSHNQSTTNTHEQTPTAVPGALGTAALHQMEQPLVADVEYASAVVISDTASAQPSMTVIADNHQVAGPTANSTPGESIPELEVMSGLSAEKAEAAAEITSPHTSAHPTQFPEHTRHEGDAQTSGAADFVRDIPEVITRVVEDAAVYADDDQQQAAMTNAASTSQDGIQVGNIQDREDVGSLSSSPAEVVMVDGQTHPDSHQSSASGTRQPHAGLAHVMHVTGVAKQVRKLQATVQQLLEWRAGKGQPGVEASGEDGGAAAHQAYGLLGNTGLLTVAIVSVVFMWVRSQQRAMQQALEQLSQAELRHQDDERAREELRKELMRVTIQMEGGKGSGDKAEKLQQENEEFRRLTLSLMNETAKLKSKLSSQRQAHQEAQQTIEVLQGQTGDLESSNQELDNTLKQLQFELETVQGHRKHLQEELNSKKSMINTLQHSLMVNGDDNSTLSQRNQHLESENASMSERLTTLQSELRTTKRHLVEAVEVGKALQTGLALMLQLNPQDPQVTDGLQKLVQELKTEKATAQKQREELLLQKELLEQTEGELVAACEREHDKEKELFFTACERKGLKDELEKAIKQHQTLKKQLEEKDAIIRDLNFQLQGPVCTPRTSGTLRRSLHQSLTMPVRRDNINSSTPQKGPWGKDSNASSPTAATPRVPSTTNLQELLQRDALKSDTQHGPERDPHPSLESNVQPGPQGGDKTEHSSQTSNPLDTVPTVPTVKAVQAGAVDDKEPGSEAASAASTPYHTPFPTPGPASKRQNAADAHTPTSTTAATGEPGKEALLRDAEERSSAAPVVMMVSPFAAHAQNAILQDVGRKDLIESPIKSFPLQHMADSTAMSAGLVANIGGSQSPDTAITSNDAQEPAVRVGTEPAPAANDAPNGQNKSSMACLAQEPNRNAASPSGKTKCGAARVRTGVNETLIASGDTQAPTPPAAGSSTACGHEETEFVCHPSPSQRATTVSLTNSPLNASQSPNRVSEPQVSFNSNADVPNISPQSFCSKTPPPPEDTRLPRLQQPAANSDVQVPACTTPPLAVAMNPPLTSASAHSVACCQAGQPPAISPRTPRPTSTPPNPCTLSAQHSFASSNSSSHSAPFTPVASLCTPDAAWQDLRQSGEILDLGSAYCPHHQLTHSNSSCSTTPTLVASLCGSESGCALVLERAASGGSNGPVSGGNKRTLRGSVGRCRLQFASLEQSSRSPGAQWAAADVNVNFLSSPALAAEAGVGQAGNNADENEATSSSGSIALDHAQQTLSTTVRAPTAEAKDADALAAGTGITAGSLTPLRIVPRLQLSTILAQQTTDMRYEAPQGSTANTPSAESSIALDTPSPLGSWHGSSLSASCPTTPTLAGATPHAMSNEADNVLDNRPAPASVPHFCSLSRLNEPLLPVPASDGHPRSMSRLHEHFLSAREPPAARMFPRSWDDAARPASHRGTRPAAATTPPTRTDALIKKKKDALMPDETPSSSGTAASMSARAVITPRRKLKLCSRSSKSASNTPRSMSPAHLAYPNPNPLRMMDTHILLTGLSPRVSPGMSPRVSPGMSPRVSPCASPRLLSPRTSMSGSKRAADSSSIEQSSPDKDEVSSHANKSSLVVPTFSLGMNAEVSPRSATSYPQKWPPGQAGLEEGERPGSREGEKAGLRAVIALEPDTLSTLLRATSYPSTPATTASPATTHTIAPVKPATQAMAPISPTAHTVTANPSPQDGITACRDINPRSASHISAKASPYVSPAFLSAQEMATPQPTPGTPRKSHTEGASQHPTPLSPYHSTPPHPMRTPSTGHPTPASPIPFLSLPFTEALQQAGTSGTPPTLQRPSPNEPNNASPCLSSPETPSEPHAPQPTQSASPSPAIYQRRPRRTSRSTRERDAHISIPPPSAQLNMPSHIPEPHTSNTHPVRTPRDSSSKNSSAETTPRSSTLGSRIPSLPAASLTPLSGRLNPTTPVPHNSVTGTPHASVHGDAPPCALSPCLDASTTPPATPTISPPSTLSSRAGASTPPPATPTISPNTTSRLTSTRMAAMALCVSQSGTPVNVSMDMSSAPATPGKAMSDFSAGSSLSSCHASPSPCTSRTHVTWNPLAAESIELSPGTCLLWSERHE